MKNKLGILIFALPFCYYLILGLFQIEKPGFYFDEAYQLLPAVNLAQEETHYYYDCALYLKKGEGFPPLKLSQRFSSPPDKSAEISGERIFPLMLREHLGVLKTYLFIAIFKIIGINTFVVRATTLALGFAVLILVYLWTSQLFNRSVGLISLLLLSSDPNFIFHTRMDFGPTVLMLIFKMAALCLLLYWWRKNNTSAFIFAFFCLGLGIWDKANFTWFVAALGVTGLLLAGRDLRRKLRFGTVLSGLTAFFLGSSPLLLFTIVNARGTFTRVMGQDPRTQRSVFDLADNIRISFDVLLQTLNGFWLEKRVFLGYFPVRLFFPYLLFFSLIIVIVMTVRRKRIKNVNIRAVHFVGGLIIGTLLFAMFTPQMWGGHHILMIYPFPHIFCGAALGALLSLRWFKRKKRRILAIAAYGFLLLALYTNLKAAIVLHRAFATNRLEWWAWSSTINEVADYLTENPEKTTVCLDWGFYRNLSVLTAGKVKMEEKWQELNSGHGAEILKDYFADKNYLYLVHPDDMNLFQLSYHNFQEALHEFGYKVRLVKSFQDFRKRDIFLLYRVVPNSLITESNKQPSPSFFPGRSDPNQ